MEYDITSLEELEKMFASYPRYDFDPVAKKWYQAAVIELKRICPAFADEFILMRSGPTLFGEPEKGYALPAPEMWAAIINARNTENTTFFTLIEGAAQWYEFLGMTGKANMLLALVNNGAYVLQLDQLSTTDRVHEALS